MFRLPFLSFLLLTVTFANGQALNGTYAIGNAISDDYATLELAVDALTNNGIDGPVIFGIRSGTYTVSQLQIPTINGASATNTIRFQPLDSSGPVILQSATYVIEIYRSDYLTFDGLTFEITADNGQSIGLQVKGSTNLNITNCLFTAMFEGTLYPNVRESFISLQYLSLYIAPSFFDFPVQHVLIENNTFRNGNGAIYSTGRNTARNSTIEIIDNVFEGKSANDIRIYLTNDIAIKNNTFTGERTADALDFRNIESQFEFSGNKQDVDTSNNSPLYIIDCEMDAMAPMIFKNNFFSSSRYITILRSSNLNIWNNSFYYGSNYYIMRLEQNLRNIAMVNNIFRANGSRLLYFSGDIDFNEFNMDHNCYHTPDNANEFDQGSSSYDFESWKTNSGLDANSILAEPNFISSGDLHLNNDVLINGKGKVLPNVVFDIDGEPRDTNTPDIGADEFDLDQSSLTDIGLTSISYQDDNPCNLLDPIQVLITNNSTFPITQFDLEWWLNDSAMGTTTIDQTIEANSSITIEVGNYPFAANTTYHLRFLISSPNGESDDNLSNNELSQEYTHFNDLKIYQEKDADCSNTYTLYVKNQPGATISWSTGETTNFITTATQGTYSVTVVSASGCSLTSQIDLNE
ncbi:MAG: hypothetical protein AAGB24_01850 [Bacteroidota bacterium]